ncbi:MobF family relaxase [Pseudomonadota bacterium]
MLSISNIKSSDNAGKYYASGDYYIKGKEETKDSLMPPEWYGKGAKYLGLEGTVQKEQFKDILEGVIKDKIGRTTVQLGRNENGIIKHAPGIDMTFSAPKSVSIMTEVGGDKRLLDAHINSIKTTLNYFERTVQTRKTKEGVMEYVSTPNITVALFTHDSSRSLDPQLHTHCVVSNIVYDEKDNKFRSAYLKSAFDSKMLLGQIYRNELAKQVNDLGYTIEKTHKDGRFEIKEVPKELIEDFSKRREEIQNALDKYNFKNAKTAAVATVATRNKKRNIQSELLYDAWKKVVQEKGYDLNTIKQTAKENSNSSQNTEININNQTKEGEYKEHNINTEERIVRDTILHISERKSCFTKSEIIRESLSLGFGKINLKQIEQNISNLQSTSLLLTGRHGLYTTKKALSLEKQVISLMQKGQGIKEQILTTDEYCKLNEGKTLNEVFNPEIKHNNETLINIIKTGGNINKDIIMSTLNNSQKQSAEFLLTTKDTVVGIQGYAGTGKTYMLSAVKEIAEAKGYKMQGLAPTASAAKTLEESSGIESGTLHKFLFKYDGYANNRGTEESLNRMKEEYKDTIFVLDESSLAGTKQMKDLLTIIDRFETRIILVGDTKQLGSVEAGKPFYALQNAEMQTGIMNEIRRQEKEHLKDAVEYSITGNIIQSFEKLKENITEIKPGEQQKEGNNPYSNTALQNKNHLINVVKDKWLNLDEKQRNNTLILTPANETRREINQIIREELKQENKIQGRIFETETLSNKGLTLTQKAHSTSYIEGDIVLFNKKYKSLNIEAGEYYKVSGTDNKNNIISLEKYISYESKNHENKNHRNNNKNIEQTKTAKENNNDNNHILWNPNEKGGRRQGAIEVFETEKKELQQGDIIRWTKNDKELGLINSDIAEILKVNRNTLDVKMKDGQIQSISKDHHSLKHLDYGYASTVHAAQGKTSENVIAVIESYRKNLTNQQTFYVEISRAKNNVELIVDDKNKVVKQLDRITGEKTEALEIISKDSNLKENISFNKEENIDNLLENIYKEQQKVLEFDLGR